MQQKYSLRWRRCTPKTLSTAISSLKTSYWIPMVRTLPSCARQVQIYLQHSLRSSTASVLQLRLRCRPLPAYGFWSVGACEGWRARSKPVGYSIVHGYVTSCRRRCKRGSCARPLQRRRCSTQRRAIRTRWMFGRSGFSCFFCSCTRCDVRCCCCRSLLNRRGQPPFAADNRNALFDKIKTEDVEWSKYEAFLPHSAMSILRGVSACSRSFYVGSPFSYLVLVSISFGETVLAAAVQGPGAAARLWPRRRGGAALPPFLHAHQLLSVDSQKDKGTIQAPTRGTLHCVGALEEAEPAV